MGKVLLITVLAICYVFVQSIGALDNSMVLYLPLDENTGKIAYDLSSFKNDATLEGSPKWVPGKLNSCIQFSSGNYLKVKDSDSLDVSKGLTIELWVKIAKLNAAQQSGVEKGSAWVSGEYNLCPEYNGGVILQIFDLPDNCDDEGQTGSAATMANGSWHFLVGVWDGNAIKIYIDGEETNKTECKGEIGSNGDPLFIGCRNGAERWVDGLMDEIKIYNRGLTTDEILSDMANPRANLAVDKKDKLTSTWGCLKTSF